MRRRLLMFGLVAGAGLLAVLGPRHGAVGQYYGSTTSNGTATKTTVSPGERVQISDSSGSFRAQTILQMNFFSHQNFLGTTTSDGSGNYRVTVSIPDDATAGAHQIRVTGTGRAGGTHTSVISLTVTASDLGDTGANTARDVRNALAVLTVGELLIALELYMTRRRRTQLVR